MARNAPSESLIIALMGAIHRRMTNKVNDAPKKVDK